MCNDSWQQLMQGVVILFAIVCIPLVVLLIVLYAKKKWLL